MPEYLVLGGGSFGVAFVIANCFTNSDNFLILCNDVEKTKSRFVDYVGRVPKNVSLVKFDKDNLSISSYPRFSLVINALPTSVMESWIRSLYEENPHLKSVNFINLSKGIVNNKLISEFMSEFIEKNYYNSLYGPTFAKDLCSPLNKLGMTLTTQDEFTTQLIKGLLFRSPNHPIVLDYMSDSKASDLMSILKNVYSIILGIVDVNENNFSTVNCIKTLVLKEYRKIMGNKVGKFDILHFAGIGDFLLTSGSNQSRNTVYGNLVGKGLHNGIDENYIVIEGLRVLEYMNGLLNSTDAPLLSSLKLLLTSEITVDEFMKIIKRRN